MLNVAIVAGGDSGEYDISIRSGKQVEQVIDRSRFEPWAVEIRGAKWICRKDGKEIPVDKNDFSITMDGRKIKFDVVFNAIHGSPGEDGKLQGYFEMLRIPYTSCDVTTSSLTFNKSFCKQVVAGYGVTMAKSVHLFRTTEDPVGMIMKNLRFPVFIKPNNGGSSVGMSKVNAPAGLQDAIDKAFREDPEILAEEFISGRELTCGVIRSGKDIIAFPVTEIISMKEFFDYEAKYQPGMAKEVVPAEVPAAVSDKCRSISVSLYEKLNCRGVVRFDYIYTGKDFFFLEVNTVPGLTDASIVPKMAAAHGWTFTELVTRLIEEAVR
jgi:D-alanine-D-alanine ligase